MEVLIEGEKKNNKNVGIDLLKIIAMITICVFHSFQTYVSFFEDPSIGLKILSTILVSFSCIGNVLFIICSSYFLVDKTKTKGEKAINLLLDSSFISIIILSIFLIRGENLEFDIIKQQIFPDLYGMYWFIPCYVVFYLLSPIVVAGLKQLSSKAHFCLCLLATVIYGLLSFKESIMLVGSRLLEFFYILNFVAFIKWHFAENYLQKYEFKKLRLFIFAIFGMIVYYSIIIFCNFLAERKTFLGEFSLYTIYNPFLLFPLIAVFYLFKNFNIKGKTISKIISHCASCTLFIYVIHENYLIRMFARKRFYIYIVNNYGIEIMPLVIILFGLFLFFASLILAVIYKETLHRFTQKLAGWAKKGICFVSDKLYGRIVK